MWKIKDYFWTSGAWWKNHRVPSGFPCTVLRPLICMTEPTLLFMVSVGMSRLAALKKSSADTATVSLQTNPSTCTVRSSAWEFVGSRTSQVDPSYQWISWSLQTNPPTCNVRSSGENSWAAEQVKLIDPINGFVSCQQVHGSGDLSAPLEAVGYYVHFVNPSTSQLNGWYYFRDP